jgi:phosphoglucomutase
MAAQNPAAGKPVDAHSLTNVPRLVTTYFASRPDPGDPAQRVSFGTSGHRGSSLKNSFNENHVLAMTQAICDHRVKARITGPLFVGIDTHALANCLFLGLVAVGADPHAYAGSAEPDATAIVIASVLDITLTRTVSV